MFRKVAATLVIASLAASPAVASTRLFCRFTGAEIVGCSEQQVVQRTTVREKGCCEHRTLQPLGAVRPEASGQFTAPTLVALPVVVPVSPTTLPSSPALPSLGAVPTGPPAFLTHRALLI